MHAVTVIVIHRASGKSHLTFVRLHAVRPTCEEQFRFITLPLLRTAIVLTVILGIVNYLKAFALVFVTTQGGPAGSTELMATYVYQQAFGTGQYRFGYSAAASFFLFVLIMAFTALSNKFGGANEVAL